MKTLVVIAVVMFYVIFMGMGLFHKRSNNKWFCEEMGWHLHPLSVGFDGCSQNGTCPRCGKSVLQDSQGNWF